MADKGHPLGNGRHGGGKAGKEHRYSLPAVDTHPHHTPPPMGMMSNTKEPQGKAEGVEALRNHDKVKYGAGPIPGSIHPPRGKS